MKEVELTIETPDGIVDVRVEPQENDEDVYYNATILYPNMVGGFSRSEIYCHDLRFDAATRKYVFDPATEDIHPKVARLEEKISAAIFKATGHP